MNDGHGKGLKVEQIWRGREGEGHVIVSSYTQELTGTDELKWARRREREGGGREGR